MFISVAFEIVRRRAKARLMLWLILLKESSERFRETFVTSFTGNIGGRVLG